MGTIGLPDSIPTKYTGPEVNLVPIRFFPARPLTTNRKYPVGQMVILKNNPSTGAEGELWYLSRFSAGSPVWLPLTSGGSGPTITLSDTAGTLVYPTSGGNIQLEGTSGQISVTANAANNKLVFSLANGGTTMDSIEVDASTAPGTDPVVADSNGLITFTGAQVASGTIGANVLRSNSVSANALRYEIQRSAAVAASDSTNNGVCHFDSAQFNIDANGFVQLDAGSVLNGINVDANTDPGTDPVVPDASFDITISGNQVATGVVGANVIRTHSAAANALDIEIQQSTTSGTKDTSKNGVSHFNSNQFSCDEGFIALTGNNSSQPAFYAQATAKISNATGDNTIYTVMFPDELFDNTGAYDPATSIFTAPTDGVYLFTGNVMLENLNNAAYTEGILGLVTTERTFYVAQLSPYACHSTSSTLDYQVSLPFSVICRMSASDTAYITVMVGPAGPKTVGIGFGFDADPRTFFSGYKLC